MVDEIEVPREKKPIFGKRTDKFSQTRICPGSASNLGGERLSDPFRPLSRQSPIFERIGLLSNVSQIEVATTMFWDDVSRGLKQDCNT